MSEEIKVSRECPHCHGSLERYEDPVAVEIINQRDTKIAALEAEVGELRKDKERLDWLENYSKQNRGSLSYAVISRAAIDFTMRDTALNSTKGEK